ncbi:hypothetical protein M407DRAFT_20283 [Tulasnella calospora MUT 4182]|uniref:Amidohydrolase-related domain-containing protein n=1 Tax=Tulasnella calospora MUT 4182 TaxID=1051891 RepID=A0A0C3LA29_9AGAM|nr:hypothetical protein M407DRAFT_20283 [Tulasnella calospora MUT 4182]
MAPAPVQDSFPERRTSRPALQLSLSGIAVSALVSLYVVINLAGGDWFAFPGHSAHRVPIHAQKVLSECAGLKAKPGVSASFTQRVKSDRFEAASAPPQLIRNATIWTGRKDGTHVIRGDILLEGGLIKAVGSVPKKLLAKFGDDLVQMDVNGAWVTPGIFDLHSHLGVGSVPELRGASDVNSLKGIAQPWLRSLDGINVFDSALALSISGGVTSSLIFPGSADAIGGQAYVIKLRRTEEGSPMSMVLEPPFSLNKTSPTDPPHWRHMKHATGENPSRVYDGTRMDTMWAFRESYNEARKVMTAQDEYCAKAEAGLWEGLAAEVPKDIKWEALVDVLRGKVKLNIHSYSPSDWDGLARLTHEFKFHIAAIHHAHSSYLVPQLLEKFYGGKPAVAMFATNARQAEEAYRGSEFAPKLLNEGGFRVIMKSDHPVLDSRYLVWEAQQAHRYGLPLNKALQAVTTTPADVAGFGHRLGYVQTGYDADIVVWDSHPLSLGATPQQVYIDGIPQIEKPVKVLKPEALQKAPKTPGWDKEAREAVKYRGLPPLKGNKAEEVILYNVKSAWERQPSGRFIEVQAEPQVSKTGRVQYDSIMHFADGQLICSSFRPDLLCLQQGRLPDVPRIDLEGGTVGPGLTSFGGYLGVVEIDQEPSTNDGYSYGPFDKEFAVVADLSRAVDGLSFDGRDMLLAYRAGVTNSVAAPRTGTMFSGLSVALCNGASHSLENGAIIKDITAVHVVIGASYTKKQPSVSTQIGLLRQILMSNDDSKVTGWFKAVVEGQLPLIVHTEGADIMAKLLELKAEVEATTRSTIRMAFFGATEAHLLAKQLADARVGVIVSRARSFPLTWDARRMLPGPPLTWDTNISVLLRHGVTVGVGILEGWEARNTRFEVAWAALQAPGDISKEDALALASSNLEKIFGLPGNEDFVAYKGGDMFDSESKVVAVMSKRRAQTELFA